MIIIRFVSNIVDKVRNIGHNYHHTNLKKVFIPHKIILVINVPLWTDIKSGAMMEIEIFKYRGHIVLVVTLVKIW